MVELMQSEHNGTFEENTKLGRDTTKPVFGVSDKARLKPVSSVTVRDKLEK